ncbi:MAG: M13 family metallopeptidase [Chloroflexota bacterium]
MKFASFWRNFTFVSACCALTLTGCGKGDNGAKMNNVKAIDAADMDTKVKPGDDFFEYANGGWLKKNPIPGEYSRYGAFEELNELNLKQMRELMESAAKSGSGKGTNEQKIGDFYSSGMDQDKINKDKLNGIKFLFDKVDGVKTIADVQRVAAELHTYGIYPMFYIYSGQDEKNSDMVIANFYQGGLGLPDRDYYVGTDKRSGEIRDAYLKHVEKMFTLANLGDGAAAAKKIMDLETKLAKASSTRLELRDPKANYNKMKVEELVKLAPDFDWMGYFKTIGINNPGEINIGQTRFAAEFSKLQKSVPVEDWKTYMKWNILNETSNYLASDFEQEHFNFYGKSLTGREKMQDRWKRVLNTTSGSLGEAVGKLYVEKHFPPEAKKRMLDLVNNLKAALKERIQKVSWMSEGTRQKALEKLATINVKIGYPDKWEDYSKLEITPDSYVKNVLNANRFQFAKDMAKINKPVDRKEWHMTPQTVNAYYSPNMNEIVFPAAILQPPFFYLDADDAVNYGAIGVVIGHEMTHGFDDQGRQYDKVGNLQDWWTADDAKKFDEKAKVIIDQYSKIEAMKGVFVDGKLTIGENIADFGGLSVSYDALQKALKGKQEEKIDGFTPDQRFFLSYAKVWRNNIREQELMKRIKEDVHSPGMARVNGGVANIPAWYKAFDVKPGDKLYIPENLRANIW